MGIDRSTANIAIESYILGKDANNWGHKFISNDAVPYCDIKNRQICSPMFGTIINEHDDMLVRGKNMHEAGHARLTPEDKNPAWSALKGKVMNALEDLRIERAIGRLAPIIEQDLRGMNADISRSLGVRLSQENSMKPVDEALLAMMFMENGLPVSWNISESAQKYVSAAYPEFQKWQGITNMDNKSGFYEIEQIADQVIAALKDAAKQQNQQEQQNQKGNGQHKEQQQGDSEQNQQDNQSGKSKQDKQKQDGQENTENEYGDADNSDNEENGNSGDADEEKTEKEGQQKKNKKNSGKSEDGEEENDNSDNSDNNDNEQDDEENTENGDSEDSADNSNQKNGNSGDSDSDSAEQGNSSADSNESADNSDENSESGDSEMDGFDRSNQSPEREVGNDGEETRSVKSNNEAEKEADKKAEERLEQDFENSDLAGEELSKKLEKIMEDSLKISSGYTSFTANDIVVKGAENKSAFDAARKAISSIIGQLSNYTEDAIKSLARVRMQRNLENGRIDRRKLVGLSKSLTKKVFYKTRPGIDLNTAITIMIDESGSIGCMCKQLRSLAIAFSEVFTKLGIKFEVLGYTTHGNTKYESPEKIIRTAPIKIIEHKTFNETYQQAKYRLGSIDSEWCNIDGESILLAYKRIAKERVNRRIIFVLSDGMPNQGYCGKSITKHLYDSIQFVRKNGTEVYGFGIGTNEPQKFYGNENFLYLKNISELGPQFFRRFREIIAK